MPGDVFAQPHFLHDVNPPSGNKPLKGVIDLVSNHSGDVVFTSIIVTQFSFHDTSRIAQSLFYVLSRRVCPTCCSFALVPWNGFFKGPTSYARRQSWPPWEIPGALGFVLGTAPLFAAPQLPQWRGPEFGPAVQEPHQKRLQNGDEELAATAAALTRASAGMLRVLPRTPWPK